MKLLSKKLLIVLFVLNTIILNASAINWQEIKSNRGISYLDTDSILKTDKYYFYNIKFLTDNNKLLVLTIQSALNSPFSARIKVYSPEEYEKLNGDYKNIEQNATSKLEPVFYGSVVQSAYKLVKTLDMMKANSLTVENVNE